MREDEGREIGIVSKDLFVTTVPGWLALDELQIPEIPNQDISGSIYEVVKVGFLVAGPSECHELGIPAQINAVGQSELPTIVVDAPVSGKVLYRLPLELTEWAETCVAMAHSVGFKPFPAMIEFGILDGRAYAEML